MVERTVALALLLLLAIGCILVLEPFISALLWSVIVVVPTWPIYVRLNHLLGGRRTQAALLMTLSVALLLLGPLVMLGVSLGQNAADAAQWVRATLTVGLPPLPEWLATMPIVGSRLQQFWTRVAHDNAALAEAARPYVAMARDWLIARGGDLLEGIIQITIGLFAVFFHYRDGARTAEVLNRIIARMAGERSARLLNTARSTVNGVVLGVLGTALVQALLMGLAFYVAGIPAPLLLAFVSFFLSLIPLGLAALWLPAAIWLASNDATGLAMSMALWGLFVGTFDNWLRPILILQQSGALPLVLVLLGILGGALVFGFLGIVLGPVLLAIGYSLLREWGADEPASGMQPHG